MKYKRTDITFDGRRFHFAPGVYRELKIDFCEKDVDEEITRAQQWLLAHDKKDHRLFLIKWLIRARKKMAIRPHEEPRYTPQPGNRSADGSKPTDFLAELHKLKGKK